MTENSQCQIILLCGYFGAGKTTLIQHILKNKQGLKVAVIQNEFADEMGIEAPLMKDSNGTPFDKFYELPNGCICCSARTELMVAIDYLIQQEQYKLQYILIENNGLADPSPTIKTFWVDKEEKYPAQLASVKTIVASHKVEKYADDPIYRKQIVFSDIIYLNHKDQIDEKQQESNRTWVQSLNPLAKIIETSYGEIDLNDFFYSEGFTKKSSFVENLEEKHLHGDKDIVSFMIKSETDYDLKKLEQHLGEILWEEEHSILRAKGIVSIENDPFMYSFQCVEDVFEVVKSDTQWENKKESKFLFIGKTINQQQIQSHLLS